MNKRSTDVDSPPSAGRSKSKRQKTDDSPSSASSSSSSSTSMPRESDWKPCSRDVITIHERMLEGVSPRQILQQLVPDVSIDGNVDDAVIWQIIVNLLTEPPIRSKLTLHNTLDDVVRLLQTRSKIVVLTGAGVSVSCGIPDFRSRNGIYARLRKDFPDLPSPEAMFDLEYFRKNPKPFYEFAREIFPGQYQPSLSHRFVKELENHGKLLRNYTQNIDVLENIAGIQRVVQCHGSFATASCCECKHRVDCDAVKDAIFERTIPRCVNCPDDTLNIMKPDIVFFGEDLPSEFHERFNADKEEVDLLIVIGSSLKVRPVALVPNCIPNSVPQILINREPLEHLNFDIELLGNCDTIISELCHRLEWTKLAVGDHRLRETVFSENSTSTADPKPVKRNSQSPPQNSQTTSLKRARVEKKQDTKDVAANAAVGDSCGKSDDTRRTLDVEELRKMYKPRLRNLASELEGNTYLFVPPSRYIFSGAEVFEPWDDADDDDSSSTTSSSSASSSDYEYSETNKKGKDTEA